MLRISTTKQILFIFQVLDVKGNGPKGTELIVWNRDFGLAPNQCFRCDNGALVTASGLALDLANNDEADGAKVIGWELSHAQNQQWQLVSYP